VSSEAEAALASAWIIAQDDLDDPTRMDSVRVAADRLQAAGHPLGELVTLGLAALEQGDASVRASLQARYLELVSALLPEVLGPFAALATHPQAFDMRWSLCYLEKARLPLRRAHLYAGLLGVDRLDAAQMLAMFLARPAARCLRSLTLDVGHEHEPRILEVLTQCRAPLEVLIVSGNFLEEQTRPAAAIGTMPYLHTLVLDRVVVGLPGGDPNVPWSGDANSIRTLGRAVTGREAGAREQALARMQRMGRNSERYRSAVEALEALQRRRVRIDEEAMLAYANEASSLEAQRVHFNFDAAHAHWVNHPTYALRNRWRALVRYDAWFEDNPLELALREHDGMHGAGLEELSYEEMLDNPRWVEFRRQAAEIGRLVAERRR
jgi:hypothetical protein